MDKSQALAFIDCLTGWIDVCEGVSTPKSPYVRTHLEAVLGLGKIPQEGVIRRYLYQPNLVGQSDTEQTVALVEYLRDVVNTLEGVVHADQDAVLDNTEGTVASDPCAGCKTVQALNERIVELEKLARAAIRQIEWCGYECEAGIAINNVAVVALRDAVTTA